MTPLRPFFCFYGGKWRAACHYPAPRYAAVIEPFAGSAGYAVRNADRNVILVEKDPVIAALWRYLIRVPRVEILRIPLLGTDETVDDLVVCPEARTLVGFWLNKGVSAPRIRPSAWMRSGNKPDCFWGEHVRDRIARQVEFIRHWRVVEACYSSIRAPKREATWFVDPPYKDKGRFYQHGSEAIDFSHLGSWVRDLQGQVIACEQDGADWLPFRSFRTLKANVHTGSSKEVIWTNEARL